MFEIRRAQLSDAPSIIAFQVAMALETEHMRLDASTVQKGVHAVFADPSKGSYWVATSRDSVVGSLLTIPEWSDWRNGTVLWIHSVYVLPEKRQLGIYRQLYSRLKAEVELDAHLKGLRLYVDKSNLPAKKVYSALGMTDEHYALFEWMKA